MACNGSYTGSSPLTRGKLDAAHRRSSPLGLIPAHAGKTRTPWSAHQSRGAHPRSRGENFLEGLGLLIQGGSSPLTRGKHCIHGPTTQGAGLIPAHAGKTVPMELSAAFTRAHPRSRGENVFAHVDASACSGSSPLTRGKPRHLAPSLGYPGLIPAHAGKTARR